MISYCFVIRYTVTNRLYSGQHQTYIHDNQKLHCTISKKPIIFSYNIGPLTNVEIKQQKNQKTKKKSSIGLHVERFLSSNCFIPFWRTSTCLYEYRESFTVVTCLHSEISVGIEADIELQKHIHKLSTGDFGSLYDLSSLRY